MENKIIGLNVIKETFDKYMGKRLEIKKKKSLEKADSIIKDLRENRNWSWYKELEYRNTDNMDSTAIFYRGVEISYQEMFDQMKSYARSLKAMGIKKSDEIPVCMSNTPEFVYLLGAVSMIGAKANIFGSDFENLNEILNGCTKKVMFVEDNEYKHLSDLIDRMRIENIVMPSLSDSFKDGIDKYAEFDKPYAELFRNKITEYKLKNDKIVSINKFKEIGKDYDGELIADTGLDDPFTVTYSSGTTSKSPKPIIHATRSFNEVSRFHDPEVNHTPSYKMFKIQATIPTYSSTGLISGISDALTQGTTLALEPIYDPKFAVDSLIINRPSYLDYTKSFWLNFARDVLYNPKYENLELPNLFICFSVGEGTDKSEERFINRALKKVKAGRKLLPLPLNIAKLSVAGGDCEHGGIFYRLFRTYSNNNPIHLMKGETAGLGTFDSVDISVLDENGDHCKPYEVGRLVATSELNMIGYKIFPVTKEMHGDKFFIKDSSGKTYGDCCVSAYQDYFGYFHLKGRMGKDNSIYDISNVVGKGSDAVLSCEVIPVEDNYVAHIEFVKEAKEINKELVYIDEMCSEILGDEKTSKILYRVHDFEESFALTHSGKRDKLVLEEEGISEKCIKPIYKDGEFGIISAKEYKENLVKDSKEINKVKKK